MTGVKTNVITAVEVDAKHSGDCPQLPGLLATTRQGFTVKQVCGDLAYSSHDNLQLIHDGGAEPLIPFKSNASPASGGLWEKFFLYFSLNREEFLAKYHQRSNVESTFSMVKAKFGDGLRSKTDTAMKNEALAKLLCHNICCLISAIYELGLTPTFWTDSAPVPQVAG
jgi:transposase